MYLFLADQNQYDLCHYGIIWDKMEGCSMKIDTNAMFYCLNYLGSCLTSLSTRLYGDGQKSGFTRKVASSSSCHGLNSQGVRVRRSQNTTSSLMNCKVRCVDTINAMIVSAAVNSDGSVSLGLACRTDGSRPVEITELVVSNPPFPPENMRAAAGIFITSSGANVYVGKTLWAKRISKWHIRLVPKPKNPIVGKYGQTG